MLKKLAKVANRLDQLGLTKEADVLDRFLNKLAQMEDMSESDDDSSESSGRVAKAIENSAGMPHFENAFLTRNPSPESEGSTFLTAQSAESLASAEWTPYNHEDVISPAVAFKADIPGYFGLVNLEELCLTDLGKKTPVQIVKAHKGAIEEAACLVSPDGISRPKSEFTTILLGPGKEGEIVWTFFPGPPISPRSTPWTQELVDSINTAGAAVANGFKWAKLAGS
jgi:hypothetical protein